MNHPLWTDLAVTYAFLLKLVDRDDVIDFVLITIELFLLDIMVACRIQSHRKTDNTSLRRSSENITGHISFIDGISCIVHLSSHTYFMYLLPNRTQSTSNNRNAKKRKKERKVTLHIIGAFKW